ncbi:hypothetical protein [Burkholderia sp. BCC0405]|uniref:hypothetical protein n=1 Tax=Burkholderia sp. BCC0405 TaxID=2676298 RepID=UPI001FC7EF7C|nr:hypothetical protein [Burkholderia sp. BCC0405]
MSTVEAKLNYAQVFGDVLDQLKSTDAYRHFLTFSRSAGHFPLANYQGKTIEVWCSNDYLGMGQHEKVIASFRHALEQFGAGSGDAQPTRAIQDQFYGERSGKIRDPFGYDWLIGHAIETVAPDEMQRRYTALLSGDPQKT